MKATDTKFNSKNIKNKNYCNIKGISYCYHCKSNNLVYDEFHDEIYCKRCGTVLRQALNDYYYLFMNNE
jgi:ribosomal protein S27E